MRKSRFLLAGVSAAAIGSINPFAIAHAQDTTATAQQAEVRAMPGEIVVTARKRSERLLDVPETIQAVTSETLDRAGIVDLNDLARITPNTVLNRRQDNEPNVVIRGVGSFGNTQGIGFYIDDVQNFTDQSPNMNDVERVEILKGPQGTLYGGSNVGGAVKYVMKKPGDEFGVEGKVDIGTFKTFNAFAAVDAPLSSDGALAARISGYHNRFGGFMYNPVLDERPDESRETGVRIALAYEPSSDLSFYLSYRHSKLKNGGNVYTRADNVEDYSRTVSLSEPVYNHRTIDGVIFQAEYSLPTVTLTSISSYARRKNNFLFDVDYSAAPVIAATTGDRDTGQVYTQELRLTSDNDSNFDWIAGAYFSKVDNRVLTNNADFYLGPVHPLYPLLNPDGDGEYFLLKDFFNADVVEKQYAGFVTANYSLGALRLGAGLRLNRSEYRGVRRSEDQVLVNNKTTALPKISLAYDLGDSLLYANFAQGTEPGRANVIGDFADLYRPEKADNYEIGIKGQTAGRQLSYEFAGFYINYQDRQQEVNISDPDRGIIELITNVGKSRSYGAEGSVTYRPTSELTLSLGAGWLNSTWRNGEVIGPDVNNPSLNVTYQLRGKEVPNSPSFSSNASIDWQKEVASGFDLGLRADWTRAGDFYWDLRNRAKQDSYDIVNLAAFFGDADGRWKLSARVENLLKAEYFNENFYAIFGQPDANGNCNGCSGVAPGAPRRFVGSISFDL